MTVQPGPTEMDIRPLRRLTFRPRALPGGGRKPEPPHRGAVTLLSLGRPRSDLKRYSVSAVLAATLHIAVVAALLFHWPNKNSAAAQPAAMMVDLAPLPSSMQPVVKLTPPGPQQVEAHPKPQPKEKPLKIPKFKPPPVMKGEAVLPKIEDKPTPEQPSPDQPPSKQSSDQPTTVAPKAEATAAPSSGASSNTPRTVEEAWEDAILAKLEREKRYPGLAQAHGLEDVVYLKFTVDREGHVLQADIDHSKGIAMLDDEVLSLIHRAQPLPPPPATVKGDEIELVVPVEFFLKHHQQ